METGLNALAEVDTAVALRPAAYMLILTVSGLNVLGPVLAQGPVSPLVNRLTVNNPSLHISLCRHFIETWITSPQTTLCHFDSDNFVLKLYGRTINFQQQICGEVAGKCGCGK